MSKPAPFGEVVSALTRDDQEVRHIAVGLGLGRGRVLCRLNASKHSIPIEDPDDAAKATCEGCWVAVRIAVHGYLGWSRGAPSAPTLEGSERRYILGPREPRDK